MEQVAKSQYHSSKLTKAAQRKSRVFEEGRTTYNVILDVIQSRMEAPLSSLDGVVVGAVIPVEQVGRLLPLFLSRLLLPEAAVCDQLETCQRLAPESPSSSSA